MRLPDVVAVLVTRDEARVATVFIAVHLIIIGDSDVVVAEHTIHAVVNRVAVVTAVGNAGVLTGMSVEVAAFPTG